MKREGKYFSGRTPITTQPSTSKPHKKPSKRKQRKDFEVPHPSDSTADVPNEEHVPTYSNDPLLSEHTKTAQAQEIINLNLRVKKLEKKARLRTHKFKRLYKVSVTRRVESSDAKSLGAQEDASKQGRSIIEAIDRDAEVTLVETQRRNDENDDNLMFDSSVFDGDEIVVETKEPVINAATTTKTIPVSTDEIDLAQEITLAQALALSKSVRINILELFVLVVFLCVKHSLLLFFLVDTKPYIKLRSSRSVHWDQQMRVYFCLKKLE
ncbi:hypothetical protein Tco_0866290 [Tanacetum coccineum]